MKWAWSPSGWWQLDMVAQHYHFTTLILAFCLQASYKLHSACECTQRGSMSLPNPGHRVHSSCMVQGALTDFLDTLVFFFCHTYVQEVSKTWGSTWFSSGSLGEPRYFEDLFLAEFMTFKHRSEDFVVCSSCYNTGWCKLKSGNQVKISPTYLCIP